MSPEAETAARQGEERPRQDRHSNQAHRGFSRPRDWSEEPRAIVCLALAAAIAAVWAGIIWPQL